MSKAVEETPPLTYEQVYAYYHMLQLKGYNVSYIRFHAYSSQDELKFTYQYLMFLEKQKRNTDKKT